MASPEHPFQPPEFFAPDARSRGATGGSCNQTGSEDSECNFNFENPSSEALFSSTDSQPDRAQESEASPLSLEEQLELWLRRKHPDYGDDSIRWRMKEYMADEILRNFIDAMRQIDEEIRRDRPDLPWTNWYDR